MRSKEVDWVECPGPCRVFRTARLVVLMLFSLVVISACGGGSGGSGDSGGGGAKWTGAVTLIPENVHEVRVWDIAAIVAGDTLIDPPRELEFLLGPEGEEGPVSLEDISSFAIASLDFSGGSEELSVVKGDFDFESIRTLYEAWGLASDTYRGYEVWGTGLGDAEIALLEDEGSLLIGEGSAVKTVLDALDQGSGFLLDDNELRRVDYVDYIGVDADEYIGMTLNRAHGGFYAFVMGGAMTRFDGCCWSSGWSASMDSGSDVHLTMIFPFAQEKNAQSQKDEVEAFLEINLSGVVPLDDVKVDGLFVIATATIEEGAWEEVAERLPF